MKSDLLLRLATCPVGDGEPECRAFTFYGIRSDLTAKFGDNSLRYGESQSGSFFIFIQFHEALEYIR